MGQLATNGVAQIQIPKYTTGDLRLLDVNFFRSKKRILLLSCVYLVFPVRVSPMTNLSICHTRIRIAEET